MGKDRIDDVVNKIVRSHIFISAEGYFFALRSRFRDAFLLLVARPSG